MSMGLPPTTRPMRPSCGTRRSAMSRSAMTLSRLITPFCMRRGTDMISCSTPSRRKRTMSSLACGSKWMSLAASSTDCAITEFTSLTIGGSSVISRMSVISSSPAMPVVGRGDLVVEAVQLADGAHDVFFAGDGRHDRVAGHDAQVVGDQHVGRVDHGDLQACCRRGNARGWRSSGGTAVPTSRPAADMSICS